jgi:hypothetical protein
MASVKSSLTSTTTVTKGKRKLAQTKSNDDPSQVKTRVRQTQANSPPPKRRTSDRIANKLGKKRASMEDDEGFVFTRPSKQRKLKPTEDEPPQQVDSRRPTKPFVLNLDSDVSICFIVSLTVLVAAVQWRISTFASEAHFSASCFSSD